MCRSRKRHAAREGVGVFGQYETLLHQRIDGVFALVGVLLRALLTFFDRETRSAAPGDRVAAIHQETVAGIIRGKGVAAFIEARE